MDGNYLIGFFMALCHTFFIIVFELFRKKQLKFDFLSIFHFFFFLYYLFPGLYVYSHFSFGWFGQYGEFVSFTRPISASLCVLIFHVCVTVAFYCSNKPRPGESMVFVGHERRKNGYLVLLGLLALIVAFSLVVYVHEFGGIKSLLSNLWAVKHKQDVGIQRSLLMSIILRFLPFAAIGFTLALSGAFFARKVDRPKYALFALYFFGCVFLFAMSKGSRGPFLGIIVAFVGLSMLARNSYNLKAFIPAGILAAVVLFLGKPFFSSLSEIRYGVGAVFDATVEKLVTGKASGVVGGDVFGFETFARNFLHYLLSCHAALGHVQNDFSNLRYFVDLPNVLLNWINALIGGSYRPLSLESYNSIVIRGGLHTFIPPGIIGFGIYSLWYPGIILVGSFIGFLGAKFQKVGIANFRRGPLAPGLLLIFVSYANFRGGEFRSEFNTALQLCFLLILFHTLTARLSIGRARMGHRF